MFADPLAITVAGSPLSLARTGATDRESHYRATTPTGEHYHLDIGQRPETKKGRQQATVALTFEDVVTNELDAGTQVPISVSARFTIDYPATGVVQSTLEVVALALAAWVNNQAVIAKLANHEL